MGSWVERNLLGLIALFSAVVAPIITLIQIWRSSLVQMKQIRPAVVHHECRICWLGIYTYFDENNKLSEPACVYLSTDNLKSCMFDPKKHTDTTKSEQAEEMLKINKGKCYLSLWGSKVSSK